MSEPINTVVGLMHGGPLDGRLMSAPARSVALAEGGTYRWDGAAWAFLAQRRLDAKRRPQSR